MTITLAGMAGWFFAIGGIALGVWFVRLAFRLHRDRSDETARRVFFASLLYLPILLALMVVDRGPASGIAPAMAERIDPDPRYEISTGK